MTLKVEARDAGKIRFIGFTGLRRHGFASGVAW